MPRYPLVRQPKGPRSRFSNFPPELIIQVVSFLGSSLTTVNALLRTNRHFTAVLSPLLNKLGTTVTDTETGRSLLHWAAATGRDALVLNLLEFHADINASDWKGDTPLHTAILRGRTLGVEMLLQHGADTGIRNESGWTALHLAAITGNCAIVQHLVRHGADIMAPCGMSMETTALHYAVMLGHVPVARVLMEYGANTTAPDLCGRTAAHYAVGVGRKDMILLVVGSRRPPSVDNLRLITCDIRLVRSYLRCMVSMDRGENRFHCGRLA